MPAAPLFAYGWLRQAALGVLLTVAATACASSAQAPEGASLASAAPQASTGPSQASGDEATPSTTPSPDPAVDPAVQPATIDVAYLDTVMDRLDQISGDAYRSAKESGQLDEAYQSRIRSVFVPDEASRQIAGFEQAIGIEGLAEPPGDPQTKVREIISMRPECVFFTADRDVNPLLRMPIEANQPYYLQLVAAEPNAFNPFPWALGHVSFLGPGVVPDADLCA